MDQTIFERYGGFARLNRVVSALYERILESDRISAHFAGVDMRRLVDHQTKFISQLMGGPAAYSGEMLRDRHAHLRIAPEDFDELLFLLRETLEDHDFAPADIDAVLTGFQRYRTSVVSRAVPEQAGAA